MSVKVDPLESSTIRLPGARDRYERRRAIVLGKLSANLQGALEAGGVDMWLIIDRESVADPISSMIGGAVGDGNVYAFWRANGAVGRAAFISHGVRQDLLDSAFGSGVVRFGYEPAGFAPHLRSLVEQHDPRKIAVNMSADIGMADGLTSQMLARVQAALGPFANRLVSSTDVARHFVTKRTLLETDNYRMLTDWSTEVARRALSSEAIKLGETTPDDLHWWTLDLIYSLGLEPTWAVPGVRVTRGGEHRPVNDASTPLRAGDIVNLDLGLVYLGYQTDIKRNAVILGDSMPTVPVSLAEAFEAAVEARQVVAQSMVPGRVGHDAWREVIEWGRVRGYGLGAPVAGGLVATTAIPELGVYCHSVGSAVHDAGARVGPPEPGWGARVGYVLEEDRWYALEFHVSVPVPEWAGKTVKVGIEEAVILRREGIEYLTGTQDTWWTVGP